MTHPLARSLLPLLGYALLAGCGAPPAECDPICDQALAVVESCLDEWGQEWGEGFGYTDPDDHGVWCQTFLREQALLAVDRDGYGEGLRWAADTCTEQLEILEQGECADYAGSWSLWEPVP